MCVCVCVCVCVCISINQVRITKISGMCVLMWKDNGFYFSFSPLSLVSPSVLLCIFTVNFLYFFISFFFNFFKLSILSFKVFFTVKIGTQVKLFWFLFLLNIDQNPLFTVLALTCSLKHSSKTNYFTPEQDVYHIYFSSNRTFIFADDLFQLCFQFATTLWLALLKLSLFV